MSNFNIALLRTLNKSLTDSLTKVNNQLTELLDSKINVGSFTGAEDVHLVANGLLMIKAWGEYNFALNLHSLLKAIKEDKISDDNLYYQAIKISRNATKALSNHLSALVEKDAKQVSLVSLWPVWSEVSKLLGKKDISVNNLFVPYPNFNDVKFERVEETDLYSTVEEYKEKFDEESNKWLSAQDKETAIIPLKRMIDLVDTLYQLRHTVGYQSYWLALKGRLILALNDPNIEIDDKVNLAETLSKASFEMRSFAQGKKIIDIEVLQQVMLPLLSDKAQMLSLKNNTISEVYQRFDINRFLSDAKNALSLENQEKVELFNQNITVIKQALHSIKESWGKHTSIDADKKDLLASIRNLLMKKDVFPQNGTTVALLSSLYSVFNKYKIDTSKTKIDEVIGREFATLLIMLDKYIEKKCIVSEEFQKQVEIEAKRVDLALLDKKSELSSLPLPSWDDDTRSGEYNKAQLIAISEVKKDFEEIERILDDILRGNEDGLNNISKIDTPARMAIGALTLMKEAAAVNVLTAIRRMCNTISINQSIHDDDIEALTLSMSGMGLFFNALEKGDKNAVMMLAPAVKLLFGKDISAPKEIPNFNFDVGEQEEVVSVSISDDEIIHASSEEISPVTEVHEVVEKEPDVIHEANEEVHADIIEPIHIEENNVSLIDDIELEKEEEKDEKILSYEDIIKDKQEDTSINVDSLFAIKDDKETNEIVENNTIDNNENSEEDTVSLNIDSLFNIKEDDLVSESPEIIEVENTDIEEVEKNEDVSTIYGDGIEEESEEDKAIKPQLIKYNKEDPSCFYGDYLEEILEDIKPSFDEALESLKEDESDIEALRGLRRVFHTLKGSGKQVGLWPMAYIGQYIEYRFNDILANHKPWTPELEKLAVRSMDIYVDWADKLINNGELDFDPSEILQLLDEEELSRGLDDFNEEEDDDENDTSDFNMDNLTLVTLNQNVELEDKKSTIKAETTDLSKISSLIKEEDADFEKDKVELKIDFDLESESEPEPEPEPTSEEILIHEMNDDERNNEDNINELGIDKIDPLENDNIDTSEYLPVFEDEPIESEQDYSEEEHAGDVNTLFIKIDTIIDNIRDDFISVEEQQILPSSLFDNLNLIKEVASDVNYHSLENILDKYVIKLEEVKDYELSTEDIVNIIAVKDIIVDGLIKIVDNEFLMDIDAEELIENINKDESSENNTDIDTIEEQEDVFIDNTDTVFDNEDNPFANTVLEKHESFNEILEDNPKDIVIEPEESKVLEENVLGDIDKEKQLDIILTTLLNMKDNLDVLRDAFLKLYK